VYQLSNYAIFFVFSLPYFTGYKILTTLDKAQLLFGSLSSILPIMSFVNNYNIFDVKIWLISKLLQYIFIGTSMYEIIFKVRSLVLTSMLIFILADYHHINQSSLFFNLAHAGIQSIKNKSCKSPNIIIEVEQANLNNSSL
jgi:hypothetical protein